MISRSTTKLLAKLYGDFFALKSMHQTSYGGHRTTYYNISPEHLYDFLYERNYETWFLGVIEREPFRSPRTLEEFIMKINTGESLFQGTANWTLAQKMKLGQRYLKDLAEDMLEYHENPDASHIHQDLVDKLKAKLELDGYLWNPVSKKLLFSEEAVLDVKEEQGVLATLSDNLSLGNREVTLHHLALSEEHYVNGKWDDSISQSRKFMESILQEVAARHSFVQYNVNLPMDTYDHAQKVRDYLEKNELIESKEKEAISKIYGLLSDTGNHPYIAEKDQARLMRNLALTISEFIMLRLNGYLKQKG